MSVMFRCFVFLYVSFIRQGVNPAKPRRLSEELQMYFSPVSANNDCVCPVTAQPKLIVHSLHQNRTWN